MSYRTYLVTGGFGFIGSGLVKALIKAGHRVRILDNLSRGSTAYLEGVQNEVEVINGDIRDAEIVRKAIQGVDSVCHLAYVNGTRHFYARPAYVLDVGVKGMINVIDGCLKAGVGELILASSSEVYQMPSIIPTDESVPLSIPDPHNPRYSYGGGKILSELMTINYGRQYFDRVVIFRPHNVFGPNMGWDHVIPQFITRLAELKSTASPHEEIPFPIQGTGDQTRAFIFIEDFVAGLMCVIQHGSHLNIYNIGNSEEIKIGDIAKRIAQHLQLNIRIVPGPEARGGTPRRCPDVRKLQALGFKSIVSLDKALAITAEWYVQHPVPSSGQDDSLAKIYL